MKFGGEKPTEMLSLNELLLHRNGPYQHPSWKQIRNNESGLVVKQRKNNIISVIEQPEVKRIFSDYGSEFAKGTDKMAGAIEPQFKTFTNKPMIIKDHFEINGSDTAQIGWIEVTSENGANGYLWYMKSDVYHLIILCFF